MRPVATSRRWSRGRTPWAAGSRRAPGGRPAPPAPDHGTDEPVGHDAHHGIDEVPDWDGVDAPASADIRAVIRPGLLVEHPSFGVGRVARVSGRGQGARAHVNFRQAGTRILALDHARLTPLEG